MSRSEAIPAAPVRSTIGAFGGSPRALRASRMPTGERWTCPPGPARPLDSLPADEPPRIGGQGIALARGMVA